VPPAALPLFPGYYDLSANVLTDPLTGITKAGELNYYAYFSSYEGSGYDPNDVNFLEQDNLLTSPILLSFTPSFSVSGGGLLTSPSPNPYTASLTIGGGGVVSYQNPQSYQIISAGGDGVYGAGGQYAPDNTASTVPLDTKNTPYNSSDPGLRELEYDNLTNFATGSLH